MTTTPTDVQKTKFEKFTKHPLRDKAVEFLNYVIVVADLDIKNIGITWGITLCADSKSVLRVNTSNRYLVDVFVTKTYPEGRALMCLIGEPQVIGPQSMRVHDGFKNIENSIIVTCNLGKDSSKLISEREVQTALRAHANTLVRNLPNSNWHNPLSLTLIDEDNDNHRRLLVKNDLNPTESALIKVSDHVAMMLFAFFADEGLNQEEEEIYVEELKEAAKQICESMNLSIIEVRENKEFITSLNIKSTTDETFESITPEDSLTPTEIAEIKISEHVAMMLFAQFIEPDANKEDKDNFVDEVNVMAEILCASMNIEVIEIHENGLFSASVQLEDISEFLDNLADEVEES